MPQGYAGKLLFVDLTKGTIEEEALSQEMVNNYIGGYGIGAKVLHSRMPAKADPLGPDSMLGFVTGPANATKALFGGRYTLVHKSPVTGGWNDANSGGYFGPELKKAGYDGLFISGIAEKPVYLWINDGKTEVRDASNLWGKDTKATWEALKQELNDPDLKVAAIGPAGERCAYMSCPVNDGHRVPGRGGGGAVMGSKKLKAVAVRGNLEISVADPERVININKAVLESFREKGTFKAFGRYGTGIGTSASALSGDAPVKNWGGVGIADYGEESAQKVGNPTFDDLYNVKKYACSSCPLGCGAIYKVEQGRWPLPSTERPEYETVAAFGPTLLCDAMDAIIKCNEICNLYGIDTISAGMTIGWAMECYENGQLSKADLDGIDLQWGDGESIVALMQNIAKGKGIGAVLMHGSAFAARKLGVGEEYLQTASGIELPMHDPRLSPGFARTYQYDPTPGRHTKGGLGLTQLMGVGVPSSMELSLGDKYAMENTGVADLQMASFREITNVGGFCFFLDSGADPGLINDYIEAITGIPFSPEESHKAGIRIYTLRHAFNLREGIDRRSMSISPRAVGKPPLNQGPIAGITIDHEKLADNFFNALGWDPETGHPTHRQLKNLGLSDLADQLHKNR